MMRNVFISIIMMLFISCAVAQPVTQLQDYNMSCKELKQQISVLEPQVEREQDAQLAKTWIGFAVSVVGFGVGAYNDSWQAVGGSLIGGDIIEDWNRDAYRNNTERLQHLKNMAISKGCYKK